MLIGVEYICTITIKQKPNRSPLKQMLLTTVLLALPGLIKRDAGAVEETRTPPALSKRKYSFGDDDEDEYDGHSRLGDSRLDVNLRDVGSRLGGVDFENGLKKPQFPENVDDADADADDADEVDDEVDDEVEEE
eukprot:NODE_468_length_7060_cov_0.310157.p7 type:complete len:134 gc:universal NODE_468_length_7060_cov_0.310157:4108-3707(-)